MPKASYFRFNPPTDQIRWNRAQSQAASGELILLKHVRKVFSHHMNFLDGDKRFKRYHELADVFVDKNTDLSELTLSSMKSNIVKKKLSWEEWGYSGRAVPKGYDWRSTKRAPIVMIGYNAFSTANYSRHFEGPHIGGSFIPIHQFLRRWVEVKDLIDTPFIVLHAGNENWGLFSTEFPNRTANWGDCCEQYPMLRPFLDHPMTLAVLTNQHHNITHPKVISLPRGTPLFLTHRKKLFFDSMRVFESTVKKESLMFASNSNWKHRPTVSQCIASKFANDSESSEVNHYAARNSHTSSTGRISELDYYRKLASARTGMCLAGLGYDSFRFVSNIVVSILHTGV